MPARDLIWSPSARASASAWTRGTWWLSWWEGLRSHVPGNTRERNRKGGASERLDELRVVGIEAADLVEYAGIVLLHLRGDFLHLDRCQLRRLLRRNLRGRPGRRRVHTAEDASAERGQHTRSQRAQQLVQHTCRLLWVRLAEHLAHHLPERRRSVGPKRIGHRLT